MGLEHGWHRETVQNRRQVWVWGFFARIEGFGGGRGSGAEDGHGLRCLVRVGGGGGGCAGVLRTVCGGSELGQAFMCSDGVEVCGGLRCEFVGECVLSWAGIFGGSVGRRIVLGGSAVDGDSGCDEESGSGGLAGSARFFFVTDPIEQETLVEIPMGRRRCRCLRDPGAWGLACPTSPVFDRTRRTTCGPSEARGEAEMETTRHRPLARTVPQLRSMVGASFGAGFLEVSGGR